METRSKIRARDFTLTEKSRTNGIKVIGLIIAAIIAVVFSLTGCDGKPNNNPSWQSGESETVTEENGETSKSGYFTLAFDTDGGNYIESQSVIKGEKAKEPTVPEKITSLSEYEFTGWYLGDRKWDFNVDTVVENITLKARWKLIAKYGPEILP